MKLVGVCHGGCLGVVGAGACSHYHESRD